MTEAVVRVMFFASLREAVGEAECEVRARNLHEVLVELQARFGPAAFAELTGDNVRIAVNAEMVEGNPNLQLQAGDEIAFLPPVTGG